MLRRPPESKRTDTLFPYTTRFRSFHGTDRPARDPINVNPYCYIAGRRVPRSGQKAGGGLADQCAAPFSVNRPWVQFGPCLKPSIPRLPLRSEEHTSELQSLMRISYAVFCLKKKTNTSKIILP